MIVFKSHQPASCTKIALLLLFAVSSWARPQPELPPPPTPGKLVDVDGKRVHIYCTGQGSPRVIIVGGSFSVDWGLVQPEVAKFSSVCTYDPSGMAWSDTVSSNSQPSDAERVKELHLLLENAGVYAPYVLVGYSIGGLVARLYASQYPADVAGMVLVDHAFIDMGKSSPAPQPAPTSATGDSPPVLISQTPIALDIEDDRNFSKLPLTNQQAHRWALSRSSTLPTGEMASEYFTEVDAAEGSLPYPIRDKPLVVISTLNDTPKYKELQVKLLTLSRNSRQLIAENSTHMVIIDQPEIVVRAIREVVQLLK